MTDSQSNPVDFDGLGSKASERLLQAKDDASVRLIEREYLEKGGVIAELLTRIPKLEPTERKAFGQAANQLKVQVTEAIAARRAGLAEERMGEALEARGFDGSLPAKAFQSGSLHPLTHVLREVESVFSSMGYTILDGPEVELDYYNFQALNIPPEHPSREEQDTFYLDREHRLVMRTQTSPVQIRAMETLKPPFRVIAPGRVFRNEQQDATHEHTFHQVEGLVVGEGVSVGHLTFTLKRFLAELFGGDPKVRLRPGFFPFVEPGFEFDMGCAFCDGQGCRVCKQTGWIEFCGCGMVHPNVLEAGFQGRDDVDVSKLSGFAFGFGLDRLVMSRYQIDDIRQFLSGDVRFLAQF